MSEITVSSGDGVVTITLNAPDRLNAVDGPMLDAIREVIAAAGVDPDIRALAITGAGRSFCAGANLASGAAGDATLVAAGLLVRAIVASPTPVVALVNGVAAGVGVSIALACDYVLASDAASFVLAFTSIGLMPDGGSTALVAASIGRARAQRLALTAEKLPATTAYEWGLIAEVVPQADFEIRSADVCRWLAATPPLAVAQTKAAINAATLDLDAALTREEAGQRSLMATEDLVEGVTAFLTKRAPAFKGR